MSRNRRLLAMMMSRNNVIDSALSLWLSFDGQYNDLSANHFAIANNSSEIKNDGLALGYRPAKVVGSNVVTGDFNFSGSFKFSFSLKINNLPSSGNACLFNKEGGSYSTGVEFFLYYSSARNKIFYGQGIRGGGAAFSMSFTVPTTINAGVMALGIEYAIVFERTSGGAVSLKINGIACVETYNHVNGANPYLIGNTDAYFQLGTFGTGGYNPKHTIKNFEVINNGTLVLSCGFLGNLNDSTGRHTLSLQDDSRLVPAVPSANASSSWLVVDSKLQVVGSSGAGVFLFNAAFTIGVWVYITGAVSDKWIIANDCLNDSSSRGFGFGIWNNTNLRFLWRQSSQGYTAYNFAVPNLSVGWHYLEISRDNANMVRASADGVVSAPSSITGIIDLFGSDLSVGGGLIAGDTGYNFRSNLWQLRIWKGVALHTSNFIV